MQHMILEDPVCVRLVLAGCAAAMASKPRPGSIIKSSSCLESYNSQGETVHHKAQKCKKAVFVSLGLSTLLWLQNRANKIFDGRHITVNPSRADPLQSMCLQGCNNMVYMVGTWIA